MEKTRKILLKVEKVYIHESTPEANEDIHYPGTLYMFEKSEGKFLEWIADEFQNLMSKMSSLKAFEDSRSSPSKMRRFVINFDIHDLKSIRKSRPTLGWPRLIFILKCGTTCPALHFHDGKCQSVINELQKYLNISRSSQDSNLLIVAKGSETSQLKQVSKNYVDLILRNDSESWMDSYNAAFSGLSKVTKFLHDSFIPHSEPFSQLDLLDATPDSSELTINTDKESGFAFITPAKRELPIRSKIERGLPVSARQWSSYMDSDGRICDVQKVKRDIFRGGVDPSIRQEVWKFLLGYYSWNSTYKNRVDERKQKIDDYFRMKLQWKSFSPDQESRFSALREQKHIIEKDVWRTDRCHKFFQGGDNPNITVLNDILLTHCMYNFDLGYVQGMSDLLSPILVVMEHEVDAFWCFAGFIKMLAKNFEKDQQATKNQLCQLRALLNFYDPDFTLYFEKNDSLNMLFCFRWLLILFKREFSFPDTMRLWEVIWTGLPCQNFHLVICLALLDLSKSTIIENEFGFSEILKYINDLPGRLEAEEVLKLAEGIFIQLKDCTYLTDTIKKILGLNEFTNQIGPPFNPFFPNDSSLDSKTFPLEEPKTLNARDILPPHTLSNSKSVMSSFDNMEELGLAHGTSSCCTSPKTDSFNGSIEILDS